MANNFSRPEGPADFVDLWKPEAWGFFWQAMRPVFGGSIFWSPLRRVPDGARRKVELEIHCEPSAMTTGAASAAAVDLFVRVADTFSAFFAAGYMTRGIIRTRRIPLPSNV